VDRAAVAQRDALRTGEPRFLIRDRDDKFGPVFDRVAKGGRRERPGGLLSLYAQNAA
jgi:hypothetical protein